MKTFGQYLFSLYLWTVVGLVTVAVSTLIILSLPLAIFDPERRLAHKLGVLWGATLSNFNPFWRFEIAGKKKIRKNQSYVLVANHASLSDIICLFALDHQFKWLAKKSLFSIPFLGWAMQVMGYIPLERGHHGSIKKSYQESLRYLQRNISILIFPEGTRSRTGEMGRFKSGAFRLALESQKPLLPIVRAGTQNVISKGNTSFAVPGLAYISILNPIETKGMSLKEEENLRVKAEALMKTELQKRNRIIARL